MTEVRGLWTAAWGDKQAALEDIGRGSWPIIPKGTGKWSLASLSLSLKTKENKTLRM